MTRQEEFDKRQSEMSNEELIMKVEKLITDLCQKGDRAFKMCIPPSINDSDMLLSELVKRFKKEITNPEAGASE